jgi:FAD:protein FMN transferase
VKPIASLLIAFIILAPDILCGPPSRPQLTRFEFSQIHMGTQFTILLYASDVESATRAANAAFKCVEKLDAIMSDYRETSELRRLSREPGHWVKVSRDLFCVLAISQRLAKSTDGAFDVTVGPLAQLWRRARRRGELPDPQHLARAIESTGYDKLSLNEKTRSVRLDKPGMLLDLGGIAKGYAADEAIAVLKRLGIKSALVAAGGDIVVSRPPPGARGWLIGVSSPESAGEAPKDHVLLSDGAVSTSGDNEQHVEIGGIRYSHIVDPRTGLGLTARGSVTVRAATGAAADSLATAASVLGPALALKLIDSTGGAAAIIIQATGEGFRAFQSRRWNAARRKR